MGWQEQVASAWGVEIRGFRARGGNAEVFEAYQPDLDRRVALKVTRDADASAQERFRREARTIARLTHPSIVPLHNFGVFDDAMVIMMPWFDRSLADELSQGVLPAAQVRKLFEEVREALAYAHEHGVVHRDVKPSNIMISEEGRFVLADFGIASIGAESTLTQAGTQPGTAGYLAPEVIKGEPPSGASDLYALGATLFEAVQGEPVFKADHAISAAYMHVHGEVPHLELKEDPELARAIVALLAKDPPKRQPQQPAKQGGFRWWIPAAAVLVAVAGAVAGIMLLAPGEEPLDVSHLQGCPRSSEVGRWETLSSLDGTDAAALQDGELQPIVGSPSHLEPGPAGNASVLMELPTDREILYVAAAIDREAGGAAGPAYVRFCSDLPCGQGSGSEARVLDPDDEPWFSSTFSGQRAKLLRFVWRAGDPGNDSRLLEVCALTRG